MSTQTFSEGLPLDGPTAAKRGEQVESPVVPERAAARRRGLTLRRKGLGSARCTIGALSLLVAAGAFAACGGNYSASGANGYGGGSEAGSEGPGSATVMTQRTELGSILVDGSGRTLYLFEKDRPNESECSGACAAAWPVDENSGTPKAGAGVQASLLDTIERGDGTTQVTYNSYPLYYYSGDGKPGEINGESVDAFGAEWYVVPPAGGKVEGGE